MVSYKIFIKPSAVKELETLPRKNIQRITSKIQSLKDNPRPHGCEKLSAQQQYRIRQGNYRIIYSIDDAESSVHVVKIGHRRDVYK